MPKLHRGGQRLYDHLSEMHIGDVIARQDLLDLMKWKEATLKTYLTKNMLTPFLSELPSGDLRVVKEGRTLTESDVASIFSQKKEAKLVLRKGGYLTGRKDVYRLQQKLGEGAVGHVWKAQPRGSNRAVAVKVVNPRPDLLATTVFANVKRRFGRESKNGMRLHHDAVVTYLDTGIHEGHEFLVMELASSSVHLILSARGDLPLEDSIEIVGRCLLGLQYLHGEGCVHRDVKPHNILLVDRGYVLGDLGIVKWNDLNPAFVSAGTITSGSVQLGSWYYMAPEQMAVPHEAGPESDVYSLGVTWYELLTGETPSPQMFAAGDIPDATTSEEVNGIIRQMTSYRPADRPTIDTILSLIRGI